MSRRTTGQIRIGPEGGIAEIPVEILREGDTYIAFSRALDLSSCGSTARLAEKAFAEAVDLFILDCIEKGTLERALTELGWVKREKPRVQWIPPEVLKRTQVQTRFASA